MELQNLILSPIFVGQFLSLLATIYVVYQWLFSPLAKFPGPFIAKISKLWRAYMTARGQWHRDLVKLHERYGSVVRIGPNEL